MVSIIRLFPDMTFQELKKKTSENKILLSKGYTPNFKIGTSVFRERPKPPLTRLLFFWRRARNLMLLVDGNPSAIQLEMKTYQEEGNGVTIERPALAFNFGTMKDTQDFIYKVVAKSKAEQKPISNTQFLVIALLLGAVLMFQFMLMKGVKF